VVSKLPSPGQEAELPEEEEVEATLGHNEETGDHHENDLGLLQVRRMLFSMLMKEEIHSHPMWTWQLLGLLLI
jgi:hypothetical protein